MKRILLAVTFVAALALTTLTSKAQSFGDIAIIGMGSDSAFKNLSFVTLVDFSGGETIFFTDSGWTGGAFRGGEGGASYTFQSATPAGTVISGTGTTSTTWGSNTDPGWAGADDSTIGTNGMNFSTSGDGVLAFTGSSSSPTFLFAVSSTPFDATSSSNNTEIPPGLTAGDGAVAVAAGPGAGDEFDNIYYTGITSGTAEQLFLAISDSSNWTGDNTNYAPYTSSFAVTAVPEPSEYALAICGLIVMVVLVRWRRRA